MSNQMDPTRPKPPPPPPPPPKTPLRGFTVVSYGGGTNSTALLVGLRERGLCPDAITFADTGGEKPNTYYHLEVMQNWCARVGFPPIEVVRADSPMNLIDQTLEGECLRLGKLPAKAYGFSSCSVAWKIRPQDKWDKQFARLHGVTKRQITRLIGFDADEHARVARAESHAENRLVAQKYPLYEWGWGREECLMAIQREGLPLPGKSSCFFCPASSKAQILWLRQKYPELAARALEIERKALSDEGPAPPTTVSGLGRRLNWAQFLAEVDAMSEEDRQRVCNRKVFLEVQTIEEDCGCYDG